MPIRKKHSILKTCTALACTVALAGCMALIGCGTGATGSAGGSSSETSAAAAADTSQAASSASTASADAGDTSYADLLFDTSSVHTIDITIAEKDWADLKENPLDKTKYEVDVSIDGEKIEDVSFATKGNTSLSSIAGNKDSDRYSFKINFGKFVDGQTYHGLDKLNLNNMYADATYMKDYLSYEIFRAAGVDAPLTSYVQVKINGEDFGLYLAIEEVDESYLDRNESGEGELYKPETEMLGNMDQIGGGQGGMDMPEGFEMPEGMERPQDGQAPQGGQTSNGGQAPQGGQAPDGGGAQNGSSQGDAPQGGQAPSGGQAPQGGQMPNGGQAPQGGQAPDGMDLPEGFEMPQNGEMPEGFGGFGGFGSGDAGASLKYTDDELSSYPDIFDNAETKVDEADEQRVVTALKQLSEGNVEEALDIDEVIRYFVAHNFVMSYDSYTGMMLHNYYLYENDGKLSMIPWDYNLAFGAFGGGNMGGDMPGGMGGPGNGTGNSQGNGQADGSGNANDGTAAPDATASDASSLVNCGIDTPLSGTDEADRPMWAWITSSDEYLERYHEAYDELLTTYFESGECKKEIERVRAMIAPYVENDASAFYTADEFQTAVDTLETFIEARTKSIRAQLDGALSTRTDEQDDSARIDASGINIDAMGKQER